MAFTVAEGLPVTETAVRTAQPWYARLSGGALKYALLILFFLFFLMPFVWIWFSAFKTSREIAVDPFSPPTSLDPANLVRAWTVGNFSGYLMNSVIYSVLRDIRLLETYWAFIVPAIALRLPFGIFLMRGFFKGLPPDLGDAARTDGANEWQVFRNVMLPLSWPGLATLIVFQFMWTWNEFAMPLIYVQRDELRPISLGTMFFFGRFTADRGLIAAGVTIAMIPVVILYLALQKRFIEGITAGAASSKARAS